MQKFGLEELQYLGFFAWCFVPLLFWEIDPETTAETGHNLVEADKPGFGESTSALNEKSNNEDWESANEF